MGGSTNFIFSVLEQHDFTILEYLCRKTKRKMMHFFPGGAGAGAGLGLGWAGLQVSDWVAAESSRALRPRPASCGAAANKLSNITFSKRLSDREARLDSRPILGLSKVTFWSSGTHFSSPKGTCWSQETTLGVLLAVRYSLWCSQGSLGALPETLGSPLGGPSGPPGPSKTYVFLKENNDFQ